MVRRGWIDPRGNLAEDPVVTGNMAKRSSARQLLAEIVGGRLLLNQVVRCRATSRLKVEGRVERGRYPSIYLRRTARSRGCLDCCLAFQDCPSRVRHHLCRSCAEARERKGL
jgi:hypothetical protein